MRLRTLREGFDFLVSPGQHEETQFPSFSFRRYDIVDSLTLNSQAMALMCQPEAYLSEAYLTEHFLSKTHHFLLLRKSRQHFN